MKLAVAGVKATGSAVGGSHQFSIALNSKAFHTLSSTLYKDKFGAIIREICSNAHDAHIMQGTPERPFFLFFPDSIDSELVIRDYGPGISPEDMFNVYCQFFTSTKDNENDTVGAYGLGAKTPFSYTDTFSVTSIHKGVKRIYTAFKDEGMPNLKLMFEEETDEESGLEVSIPVDSRDIKSFEKAVIRELRFFDVKPVSNRDWEWASKEVTMDFSPVQFYKSSSEHLKGFFVLVGPVGYRIDRDIIIDYCTQKNITITPMMHYLFSMSKDNSHWYKEHHSALLNMPIGTVEVQPSREGLHYTSETCQNIIDAIKSADSKVFNEMRQRLDDSYAKGYAEFYKMVSELPSFIRGSLSTISDFSTKYDPFVIDPDDGHVSVKWDESIVGTLENCCTWYKIDLKTRTITKGSFVKRTWINYGNEKIFHSGIELFRNDVVYLKDEAYAYKSRILADAENKAHNSVAFFIEPFPGQDVNKLFAYLSQYLNVCKVSSLPKKVNRKSNITSANTRSWFELGAFLATRRTSLFSFNKTLHANGVKSTFGKSLDDIDEPTVVVRTHNNSLDFSYEEFKEKLSLLAMLKEAGYNVIAIPKKKKYNNEKLCEFEKLTDEHFAALRNILKNFYMFRVLHEALHFVNNFNNVVELIVNNEWTSASAHQLKLDSSYLVQALDGAPRISSTRSPRSAFELEVAAKASGFREISTSFNDMDDLFKAVKEYTGVSVVPSEALRKLREATSIKKVLTDLIRGNPCSCYGLDREIKGELVANAFSISPKKWVEEWVEGLD